MIIFFILIEQDKKIVKKKIKNEKDWGFERERHRERERERERERVR